MYIKNRNPPARQKIKIIMYMWQGNALQARKNSNRGGESAKHLYIPRDLLITNCRQRQGVDK